MAREDYFTSTVDGAEAFERGRAMENYDPYPDGYDPGDYDPEDEPDYDPDDEPECNCSDPGCPCRGWKIGGL